MLRRIDCSTSVKRNDFLEGFQQYYKRESAPRESSAEREERMLDRLNTHFSLWISMGISIDSSSMMYPLTRILIWSFPTKIWVSRIPSSVTTWNIASNQVQSQLYSTSRPFDYLPTCPYRQIGDFLFIQWNFFCVCMNVYVDRNILTITWESKLAHIIWNYC